MSKYKYQGNSKIQWWQKQSEEVGDEIGRLGYAKRHIYIYIYIKPWKRVKPRNNNSNWHHSALYIYFFQTYKKKRKAMKQRLISNHIDNKPVAIGSFNMNG